MIEIKPNLAIVQLGHQVIECSCGIGQAGNGFFVMSQGDAPPFTQVVLQFITKDTLAEMLSGLQALHQHMVQHDAAKDTPQDPEVT